MGICVGQGIKSRSQERQVVLPELPQLAICARVMAAGRLDDVGEERFGWT
jgi:hypothetical protein